MFKFIFLALDSLPDIFTSRYYLLLKVLETPVYFFAGWIFPNKSFGWNLCTFYKLLQAEKRELILGENQLAWRPLLWPQDSPIHILPQGIWEQSLTILKIRLHMGQTIAGSSLAWTILPFSSDVHLCDDFLKESDSPGALSENVIKDIANASCLL